MRKTQFAAAITTASVLVLLVAGCSGGPADSEPTGGSSTDDMGPLSEIMNNLGGAQDEAKMNEQAAASEEIVAACMRDQGFDYIPQDTSAMAPSEADADMPDWDSLEFAQQYGYGATTWQDMPGSQTEGPEDPNADAVAAMSESEQTAYYEALYGKQEEEPAPTGVETADASGESSEDDMQEYDWTTAGCQGKAQHETYEQGQIWEDPEFKPLFDEISKLYENSADDESVLAAQEEWAQCMADAGFDFDTPQDAQQSIYTASDGIPYDETTGEQDPTALADLKKTEIATAVADRTCNTKADLDKATLAASKKAEQEFVDSHKEELDALVAKAAENAG